MTYSFPHISFRESTAGPPPIQPLWRNTIGIAGVFSRGPAGPTYITSREDFSYLFGEDSSPGSVFIRQAQLQNATNFFVSRVMPSAKPSKGSIFFQPLTGASTQEATVKAGNDRTVGVDIEMSYVGSPLYPEGLAVGSTILTNPSLPVTIPDYNGAGSLDFKVVETLKPDEMVASTPINVTIAVNTTGSFKISASGADGTALRNAVKPGMAIRLDGSDVSGATIDYDSDAYLLCRSYAFEDTPGVWAVWVEGTCDTAGAAVINVNAANPAGSDYHVLAFNFRTLDGESLPPQYVDPTNYYLASNAIGFLTVDADDQSFQPVSLWFVQGSNTYREDQVTGVELSVGGSDDSGDTELIPGALFSVPFIYGKTSVGEADNLATGFPNTSKAFVAGTSASDILALIRTAIARDSVLSRLVNDFEIDTLLLPPSLSITSSFNGSEANRVYYRVKTVASGANADLYYGASDVYNNVWQKLDGGADSMTPARLFLYDQNGNPLVRIEAISPGTYGNNLKVTVRPNPPGSFRLEVTDEKGSSFNVPLEPESYNLRNENVDPLTGLYTETLDSRLIRAYFIPVLTSKGDPIAQSVLDRVPQRVAPPLTYLSNSNDVSNPYHPGHRGVAYLQNLYLKGGSQPITFDQSRPTEEDFVEAIARLEEVDCAFISAAGITAGDASYEQAVSELVLQAERSTPTNGLRYAIISAPPRITTGRSSTVTSGISSNKVVVVAGHSTLSGARDLGVNTVPAAGFYAGLVANTAPHISPAAVSGGKTVLGVVTTDTKNTPEYLEALTQARIEVLFYDPASRQFKFLNGRTTSSSGDLRWVSVERMSSQIIMDLHRNLQWAISQPNTSALRSRIATACDAYLLQLRREDRILAFQPTVCDESNNTTRSVSTGRLNIRLTWTPVFPADYIEVHSVRDLVSEFSLTVQG